MPSLPLKPENPVSEHDNWNEHWSNYDAVARYNPAQAFRREIIISWLKDQLSDSNQRLLDIGSGQGHLVAILNRLFPSLEVVGVEMSAIGIEQSRARAPGALFFQRDLLLTPVSDDTLRGWASLSVCSEVLEHVDEPEKILANAAHYLAPGARLFITVPGGPMSAFDRHIGHRQHFNEASLSRVIRDAGLVPEKVCGVGFPFFNLYKLVAIMRGKSLITDAAGEESQQLNGAAKLAMIAFSFVLKRGLNSASSGWQMTAQARKPL